MHASVEYAVAKLTDGSELAIPNWRIDSGQAGEQFLVMAAQHGNEIQACEVIRRFRDVCIESLRRGCVYLVPFANPQALHHRRSHAHLGPEQPYGDARGHDINRTWPGKADGNDAERMAHALNEAIARHCTVCLDFHSWSAFTACAAEVRMTNERAMQMAEVSALRFIVMNRGGAPAPGGGMGISTLFNNSGRTALVLELPPQWVVREKEVRLGLRATTNIAKLLGMMDGEPELLDGPVVRFMIEERDRVSRLIYAPCSGLFVSPGLEAGDYVVAGQSLGHLIRDDDLTTVPVIANAAGYLYRYGAYRAHCDVALPPMHPYANEGDLLADIIAPELHQPARPTAGGPRGD
jgi:uncharacterized protein